ncbi:MAG: phosphoglycerate kinase [Patescibacteria group bacterium]
MINFLSKTKNNKLRGTAIVRLDFNTEDEWRMRATIPTIQFLRETGVKVVILSHRGRPKGVDHALSLKQNANDLECFLRHRVVFVPHFRFPEIREMIRRSASGSVFLLENLRFLPGEEKNDPRLAKQLASLGNFYVNDAFPVSHRAAASVSAITNFLPSYGGLILETEILHLSRVMYRPKRPLLVILGGAKAKDKLPMLQHFKNTADQLIVGGATSNTILKARGINIGNSIHDVIPREMIKEIIRYKHLMLPIDYVIHKKTLLDIGKKTRAVIASEIKKARTIIWNGPFGLIEKKAFCGGTLAIAKAIAANRNAYSVAGGGETVMFLKKYRLDKKFSFISTGGGAMFSFLAGQKLPGIEALKNSKK